MLFRRLNIFVVFVVIDFKENRIRIIKKRLVFDIMEDDDIDIYMIIIYDRYVVWLFSFE